MKSKNYKDKIKNNDDRLDQAMQKWIEKTSETIEKEGFKKVKINNIFLPFI